MKRRKFIKVGTATTTASITHACMGPPPTSSLAPVHELAASFWNSLDETQKQRVAVPYDHPMRQYHNRGVGIGGVSINRRFFSGSQIDLLNSLYYAALSDRGRQILPKQQFIKPFGIKSLELLIAGDPTSPFYQILLSGPHLNLRIGGKNREGVAFGGPQVYGDQRGNNRRGIPGNMYRFQAEMGNQLFADLSPEQQKIALCPKAPIQTQISYQGERGTFPGIPVKDLAPVHRYRVGQIIDAILDTYDPVDVAYAKECIEYNGGLNQLSLAYYQDGCVEGFHQVFRLEGPGTVFYYRGAPHLHAFINIARDSNRPFSVGEAIAFNPDPLAGESVKHLFETAMTEQLQTDLAFYNLNSVVGTLRRGEIRTGDIYNLESWAETVQLVTIKGNRLSQQVATDLNQRGITLQPQKTYRFAVSAYNAKKDFKRGNAEDTGLPLRQVVINHLKKHGFSKV